MRQLWFTWERSVEEKGSGSRFSAAQPRRDPELETQPEERSGKLSSSVKLGVQGGHSYLLDPGPQVRGALIQAGVLDEVPFTGRCHMSAMVPVEFVQVGNILMGFLAGVGEAAGILLPGAALGGEDTGTNSHAQHSDNIPTCILSPFSL